MDDLLLLLILDVLSIDEEENHAEGTMQDGSGMGRMETKDRKGNPIKNSRYMKHFYGADLTASVKCNRCQQTFDVTGDVEEQASSFNELV